MHARLVMVLHCINCHYGGYELQFGWCMLVSSTCGREQDAQVVCNIIASCIGCCCCCCSQAMNGWCGVVAHVADSSTFG